MTPEEKLTLALSGIPDEVAPDAEGKRNAWSALLDVTRKDRDALRARVAELERAADAARKAERANVVAWLHTDGPALAFASCIGGSEYTCAADAIEAGEHEGAAGGS